MNQEQSLEAEPALPPEPEAARDGDAPMASEDPVVDVEPAPAEASATAEAEVAPERMGTFFAFRYRNYRLLWIGDVFTSGAMWIQQTTIGWLVYDLTSSGSILGAINGIRVIPTLTLIPLAGTATDRLSRNKIIAVSQLGQFFVTFLLALAVATDVVEVWHLFVFTLLIAVGQAFNMPARQTFVFDLVPRAVVPNAIGLSNFAFSLARSVGPAVAGGLIVLFGPAENFFIQSAAYLSVMITVLMIRTPPRESETTGPKRSIVKDMAEGYRFVVQTPQARLLFLMTIVYPSFVIPLHLALLPIFATDVLHSGGGGLGILLASIGVGGTIGGLLTASLNSVDRRGLLQLYALGLCSLAEAAFVLVAYLTGELWYSVWFLALHGIGGSLLLTTNQTVLQLLAPDHMRGRITSVLQVSPLFMSISVFIAGAAADLVGAPAVGLTLGLTAFSIGVLIFVFSPRMRELRLSRLGEHATAAAS